MGGPLPHAEPHAVPGRPPCKPCQCHKHLRIILAYTDAAAQRRLRRGGVVGHTGRVLQQAVYGMAERLGSLIGSGFRHSGGNLQQRPPRFGAQTMAAKRRIREHFVGPALIHSRHADGGVPQCGVGLQSAVPVDCVPKAVPQRLRQRGRLYRDRACFQMLHRIGHRHTAQRQLVACHGCGIVYRCIERKL